MWLACTWTYLQVGPLLLNENVKKFLELKQIFEYSANFCICKYSNTIFDIRIFVLSQLHCMTCSKSIQNAINLCVEVTFRMYHKTYNKYLNIRSVAITKYSNAKITIRLSPSFTTNLANQMAAKSVELSFTDVL